MSKKVVILGGHGDGIVVLIEIPEHAYKSILIILDRFKGGQFDEIPGVLGQDFADIAQPA